MALIAGAVGLSYVVGGMFASSAKLRAQKEAAAIINQARRQGLAQSQAYEKEFTPFIDTSKAAIDEAAGYAPLLQRVLTETEGLDTGEGLSGADRIAYEDAAKLLNEQMVSTGNLRSGAAAFGQAQLLRRVVADANERRFNRQVTKLGLLFGGQNQGVTQALNRASTAGQIGLYGKQLSSQLLQASMGLAPAQASAEIGAGQARSDFATAAGSAPASMMAFQNAQDLSAQNQAYTDYLKSKTV